MTITKEKIEAEIRSLLLSISNVRACMAASPLGPATYSGEDTRLRRQLEIAVRAWAWEHVKESGVLVHARGIPEAQAFIDGGYRDV